MVICNQVIEHVHSDEKLAKEIARLLKPDGIAYVSSVLKSRRTIWIYRQKGDFRLDPTHIREYPHVADFVNVLRRGGLKVVELNISKFKFPLFHLLLRVMLKARLLSPDRARLSALKHRSRLHVNPPGYWLIECLAVKLRHV